MNNAKKPQLNEEINFLNLCSCPGNYLLPCFFSALNKHILRGMYLNLKHPSHLIRSNAAFTGEKYFWKMLRLFIVCLKIILRSLTGEKKKWSFFLHVLYTCAILWCVYNQNVPFCYQWCQGISEAVCCISYVYKGSIVKVCQRACLYFMIFLPFLPFFNTKILPAKILIVNITEIISWEVMKASRQK